MSEQQEDPMPQSKGGIARAASLSAEERRSIAKEAALVRWTGKPLPRATHEGMIEIAGNILLPCSVLEDGTRVLSQLGFFRAIGRKGRAERSALDAGSFAMPEFLSAENLKPFISKELVDASTPIPFKTKGGTGSTGKSPTRAVGYRADILPLVCNVFLDARDAGALHPKQIHIADRCKILSRAFALVGIAALVDEATGYQEVRDRLALQAILNRFLTAEALKWAKRFPDAFYDEIFRLRKWDWARHGSRRPIQIAKDTINLVYMRIMPELLPELEALNPKGEAGRRRAAHHQFFSLDIGSPALNEHIRAVTTLMKAFDSWDEFIRKIDRALPIKTKMSDLPLWSQPLEGTAPGKPASQYLDVPRR